METISKEQEQLNREDYFRKTHPFTDYHDFSYYAMPVKRRRELDIGDIFENTIECTKCHYIIRSRNRHDFVHCKCGSIGVDGGSWYQSITGDLDNYINHVRYYKYRSKK